MTVITEYSESLQVGFEDPRRFLVPEITEVVPIHASTVGIPAELMPASIDEYHVRDPYIEVIPKDRLTALKAEEAAANDEARGRREAGAWTRTPGTAYEDEDGKTQIKTRSQWGDPVSSINFFGRANRKALNAWRTLVPRPEALEYISDPFGSTDVVDSRGVAHTLSEREQEWLAIVDDAVGIRNRGAIMGAHIRDWVGWHRWTHGNEPVVMQSIACGTALPSMQGAMHAGIPNATLMMVDKSVRSMKRASELADEIGFTGRRLMAERDVFNPVTMRVLKEELTAGGVDNRPHLVDAMGIFEYTGEQLRTPDMRDSNSLLYNPAGFLNAVYELVRPGGRLIFGQMRNDRPNADFTMGVVRWPYICMRSPAEVMQIIKDAGIDPEMVKLSFTPDGVYSVISVDKPAESTSVINGDPAVMGHEWSAGHRTRPERRHTLLAGIRARMARVQQALAHSALNIL